MHDAPQGFPFIHRFLPLFDLEGTLGFFMTPFIEKSIYWPNKKAGN
jgi:hypothetical protein